MNSHGLWNSRIVFSGRTSQSRYGTDKHGILQKIKCDQRWQGEDYFQSFSTPSIQLSLSFFRFSLQDCIFETQSFVPNATTPDLVVHLKSKKGSSQFALKKSCSSAFSGTLEGSTSCLLSLRISANDFTNFKFNFEQSVFLRVPHKAVTNKRLAPVIQKVVSKMLLLCFRRDHSFFQTNRLIHGTSQSDLENGWLVHCNWFLSQSSSIP